MSAPTLGRVEAGTSEPAWARRILIGLALGFVFLQQIPDYLSVIGYVIIIGSAIFKWNYNLRYEEKV